METLRYCVDPREEPGEWQDALNEGARLLLAGELVAFPTETVYGIGANAWDADACGRIFQVKGRPADNPLIVHVASAEEARGVTACWPRQAQICADRFWPGPLTLVLPKNPLIPDVVTGGGETVAVRVPGHPVARELIALAGCPVAAPSANVSGRPSPTLGDHVWEDLAGRIPLLIDAGPCAVGMESTVLDVSGDVPVLLRPGGVSREDLCDALGEVNHQEDDQRDGNKRAPRSPGMKYRHYAPRAAIRILAGTADERRREIAEAARARGKQGSLAEREPLALLCSERTAASLEPWVLKACGYVWTFPDDDEGREGAAGLFAALRACDKAGIALILAEECRRTRMGLAYMNRLEKAARS